ncbi:MAG: hypothetical protein WEC00_12035 [Dongiaceae bacterium]
MTETERSFERIELADLKKLVEIALTDLNDLFGRKHDLTNLYRDRLLALAFCQGAAEHFVRPGRGVKDFDVWAFFSNNPQKSFPYRRRGKRDFGPSKFGRHPSDHGYAGRRVDILGRDISVSIGETPEVAIRRYLSTYPTKSARLLAMRPVVLLTPPELTGKVIWDPINDCRLR